MSRLTIFLFILLLCRAAACCSPWLCGLWGVWHWASSWHCSLCHASIWFSAKAASLNTEQQPFKGGKDIVLRRKKTLRLTASIGFISILALVCFASISWSADPAPPVPEVPAKGMVTMVDIGAKKCIPCKMMAPIMEELEKEYKGRAAIIFIDVWVDPSQGKRFGIRSYRRKSSTTRTARKSCGTRVSLTRRPLWPNWKSWG